MQTETLSAVGSGGGAEGRAQRSQLENGQPSDNSGEEMCLFLLVRGRRFTFKTLRFLFRNGVGG